MSPAPACRRRPGRSEKLERLRVRPLSPAAARPEPRRSRKTEIQTLLTEGLADQRGESKAMGMPVKIRFAIGTPCSESGPSKFSSHWPVTGPHACFSISESLGIILLQLMTRRESNGVNQRDICDQISRRRRLGPASGARWYRTGSLTSWHGQQRLNLIITFFLESGESLLEG